MQRIKKGDIEIKSRKICSVPQCSTYGNSVISLHKFPLNHKATQKWKTILKIGKPISTFMFVCSKHFLKDDFFIVTSTTKRKRLKNGTLPSQNLPVSKYQHSIIKTDKSDQDWLRQKSYKMQLKKHADEKEQVEVELSGKDDKIFTLHLDGNEHNYAINLTTDCTDPGF